MGCSPLPETNYSAELDPGLSFARELAIAFKCAQENKELTMAPFPPKEKLKRPKVFDPVDCDSCFDSTYVPRTLVSVGFDRLYPNFRNHP